MPNIAKALPWILGAGSVVAAGLDPKSGPMLARTWLQNQQMKQQMDQFKEQMKMQKMELDLRSRYYDIQERSMTQPKEWQELQSAKRSVSAYYTANIESLMKLSRPERMRKVSEDLGGKYDYGIIADIDSNYWGKGKTLLEYDEQTNRVIQRDVPEGHIAGEYALPFSPRDLERNNPVQIGMVKMWAQNLPKKIRGLFLEKVEQETGMTDDQIKMNLAQALMSPQAGYQGLVGRYGKRETDILLGEYFGWKEGTTDIKMLTDVRDSLLKAINQTYEDYGIKIDIYEFAQMSSEDQKKYLDTIGTERAKRVPEPKRTQLREWISQVTNVTNEIAMRGLTRAGLGQAAPSPKVQPESLEAIISKLEAAMPAAQYAGQRVPHRPTGQWFWSDGKEWHLEQ